MSDHKRTKAQLIEELHALRRLIDGQRAGASADGGDGHNQYEFAQAWEQCIDVFNEDVCILDISGIIVNANKAMRERYGAKHRNLIGQHYQRVYYGTESPASQPPWEAVLSGALSAQVELYLPSLQGWYLVSCYALHNRHGQPLGAVSSVKDITEQKRKEEIFRQIAQGPLAGGGLTFFRELALSIARSLNVPFAYIGELVPGQRKTLRTVGLCIEGDIRENSSFDAPCVDVPAQPNAQYPNGLQEQFSRVKMVADMGLESFLGRALLDSTGHVVGIMAVMDRHPMMNRQFADWVMQVFAVRAAFELERKQAQEALQESEDRYRTIAENTHDLICKISFDGRYVYVSQNYRDVLGYDPQDLIGHNMFDHIHPDDRATVMAAFARTSFGMQSSCVVYRYLAMGKEWRWFESASRLVHPAREDRYWVTVSRDITGRKRMEEDLLNARKLESIGLLAGGIAHDFNNILTAILGNVSMAKLAGLSKETAAARLVEAERACAKARELTKQLLTFAKGGEPVKATVTVPEIIHEAVDLALPGPQMHVEYALADDLWPVEADAGQIRQVFTNVIQNAIQSMPEGGTITIRAANAPSAAEEVLILRERRYVKISITDTGKGIPAKHRNKVFDPFFTTKAQGTGLGLAICYSIMTNHGGAITVDSREGMGTDVAVHLPAAPTAPARAPQPATERVVYGSGAVLVIEDEPSICALLGQTLTHLGYEPTVATDGQAGVDLYTTRYASGGSFDAVLIDLTLPDGPSGKEVMQILRALDPQVRAIVSSGYSQDPVMADFTQYGFLGAIAKPYTIPELSHVLHSVIRGPHAA